MDKELRYYGTPYFIEHKFRFQLHENHATIIVQTFRTYYGKPSVLAKKSFLVATHKEKIKLYECKHTFITKKEEVTKHYKSYFSISDSFDVVEVQNTYKVFDAEELTKRLNFVLDFWKIPKEKHFSLLSITINHKNIIKINK